MHPVAPSLHANQWQPPGGGYPPPPGGYGPPPGGGGSQPPGGGYGPPAGGYGAPPAYGPQANPYAAPQAAYPGYAATMAQPLSTTGATVLAVIVVFLACLPGGFVALQFARQAKNLAQQGRLDEA